MLGRKKGKRLQAFVTRSKFALWRFGNWCPQQHFQLYELDHDMYLLLSNCSHCNSNVLSRFILELYGLQVHAFEKA